MIIITRLYRIEMYWYYQHVSKLSWWNIINTIHLILYPWYIFYMFLVYDAGTERIPARDILHTWSHLKHTWSHLYHTWHVARFISRYLAYFIINNIRNDYSNIIFDFVSFSVRMLKSIENVLLIINIFFYKFMAISTTKFHESGCIDNYGWTWPIKRT